MDYNGKEFNDPIVRCYSCSKLVHRAFIAVHAGCNHCGNKRFRNVTGMNDKEYNALKNATYDFGLKEYKIDPDNLNEWEEADSV